MFNKLILIYFCFFPISFLTFSSCSKPSFCCSSVSPVQSHHTWQTEGRGASWAPASAAAQGSSSVLLLSVNSALSPLLSSYLGSSHSDLGLSLTTWLCVQSCSQNPQLWIPVLLLWPWTGYLSSPVFSCFLWEAQRLMCLSHGVVKRIVWINTCETLRAALGI